jgi:branched-subunit amino acid aminotransferase/4-amino-4-deoxychorismate lyase
MTIDYVRETPEIKSLNYLVPMMHWPEVMRGGFDDVLYVFNGLVSETSRANVFFVTRDDVLVTPVKDVLYGITRKYVIKVAKELGLKVEERAISFDEAMHCKEAFLSSSTKQVTPVSNINQQMISEGIPGKITKLLFDSFYDFEMKHIAAQKSGSVA